MSDPATFFGTINEIEGARVDELRSRLIAISEQCTKLEKRCPAGDELFALFAGSFNLASQPIHVIYIDDNNMVRTNVLLHHRRVTPFLYGQRNVWLVVFAENQLDLMAELTTLWRQGKGSLSRLGGIFVSEGRETVEAREAQTEETPLVLDRLGGAAADDALYYSAGRFFLEPLGVYSTSVFPVESPPKPRPALWRPGPTSPTPCRAVSIWGWRSALPCGPRRSIRTFSMVSASVRPTSTSI